MRSHTLVTRTADYETWLIEWPPGTGLDFHDHGDSMARITVLEGTLNEQRHRGMRRISLAFATGDSWIVPPHKIHRVENKGTIPAVSLHTYWPPLALDYPPELEIEA